MGRSIIINSGDRLNGTSSAFSIEIPNMSHNSFKHVSLYQALIPKSYYMITDSDYFTLTEDGITVNVSITKGNYNILSLMAVLSTALSTVSPRGIVYSMAISDSLTQDDQGKIIFTVTGNGLTQPIFTFSTFMYEQLGFNPNTSYTFVASTLTSVNVVKLTLEDAIYIHSDMVDNYGDNILCPIFVNTSDYTNIVYQSSDIHNTAVPISYGQNSIYSFYLTNENGTPIDLNGLNFIMQLILL